MKKSLPILIFLVIIPSFGQTLTVTAEPGDGIFSILRKQGLDPATHFAAFVELNAERLKGGDALVVGRTYEIPDAADSFKKTAVTIVEDNGSQHALFDGEFGQINRKSDMLQNAVIYLLPGQITAQTAGKLTQFQHQVLKNVAKELMVNGAQVYLLPITNEETDGNDNTLVGSTEEAFAHQAHMSYLIETINGLYLRNRGKYQRIVVLNFNEKETASNSYDMTLFHHVNSIDGKNFATTLNGLFGDSMFVLSKEIKTFKHKNHLYLATNVLPPIALIEIKGKAVSGERKRISVDSGKWQLTNGIANAVFTDYAQVSIEHN